MAVVCFSVLSRTLPDSDVTIGWIWCNTGCDDIMCLPLSLSSTWRTEALSNQSEWLHLQISSWAAAVCVLVSQCVCVCVLVSLPQLKDLDWRVDMVTGSDSVSRMSVPTCLVQFKVSGVLSVCLCWLWWCQRRRHVGLFVSVSWTSCLIISLQLSTKSTCNRLFEVAQRASAKCP